MGLEACAPHRSARPQWRLAGAQASCLPRLLIIFPGLGTVPAPGLSKHLQTGAGTVTAPLSARPTATSQVTERVLPSQDSRRQSAKQK